MVRAKSLEIFRAIAISVFLFGGKSLLAHGEDRYGPHGGFVRMPGAFHIEVVPQKDLILVYLLDLNWKNPNSKSSSLEVNLIKNSSGTKIPCRTMGNHFACDLPKGIALTIGSLKIRGKYKDLPGGEVEYSLPLKLQ